jgi:hypothetical protein
MGPIPNGAPLPSRRFFARLRFEQREKMAELPDEWGKPGMGFCFLKQARSAVLESRLLAKAAAGLLGHNEQNLRRLLLSGRLEGISVALIGNPPVA